jgi:hypothetical protein
MITFVKQEFNTTVLHFAAQICWWACRDEKLFSTELLIQVWPNVNTYTSYNILLSGDIPNSV